jgi:hypothetical protein
MFLDQQNLNVFLRPFVGQLPPILLIDANGQTPLYGQVGQQVGNLLANKFVSSAPDTNLLYNLLTDKLHSASLLGSGYKYNLSGAGLARAQQVGPQVGSVKFISQQVVSPQQVRIWCTIHGLVGQQVVSLFV